MAIAFAIAAAGCWGLSDFLGGLASRRVSVALVLLLVETGGIVVLLVIVAMARPAFFADPADALSAAAGGVAGILGLACFYRALAIGTMSVVAPISSAGVALPVAVGVATGSRPSAIVAIGLAAIVAGVILASRQGDLDAMAARTRRAAVGLALLAAVGFGAFFALTDGPSDASVIWTLVLARAAPLPLIAVAVALQRPPVPERRLAGGLVALGLVDLTAIALISLANTKGDLGIVSVLGGMYPVATVMLAAAVLHERLRPPQLLGVVLALAGVATVAAA